MHLIIREPKNIRVLKGAYNILILPSRITEHELKQTSKSPFLNYERMFSLVDEIWTNQKDNMDIMKEIISKSLHYFKDEIVLLEKVTALT